MATRAKATLAYLNGRGLGESVRMILAAAGIEFSEILVTKKEQLDKLRADGDLFFMQIPMLEIDGMKLVQSGTIIRYIASTYGLDGKTPEDKTRVDMLYEGARDFLLKFLRVGFIPDKDPHVEKIKTKTLPRYRPIFEKVLTESASGYLVGDGLTRADLALLEALLSAEEYVPGSLDGFPNLQEFKDRVSSVPRIKAFLEGPQRKPTATPEFVAECKEVFGLF
ncbi:glutathione S-transferase A3-like [Ptychodera flava]|uniref:glutathione S-transferase A3-like n=1 Tax=Ptychodera flava TaxID=63121 RepID=UPI00396A454E